MKEIIQKAIGDSMKDAVLIWRENSIFSDKGRVFLDAAALDYDAAVDIDGRIIDASGKEMDQNSKEYKAIVATAKKHARAQSALGSDILGS
jgi:hypothetical protein